MHSAGLLGQRRLLSVPDFSGNLVVFIPGNSGTENDRDSRAPGKREPGNPHPSLLSCNCPSRSPSKCLLANWFL